MKRSSLLRIMGVTSAALALAVGCGEQPNLPTTVNTGAKDFGASDTSFVRVNPDWDAAHGYTWTNPGDIQIGRDGYIYVTDESAVANHSNGRVVQLQQDGSIHRNSIFAAVCDTSRPPKGIGQDSKLNLYMVNGSAQVFLWNQYVNMEPPIGLIQSMTIKINETGEEVTIGNDKPYYQALLDLNLHSSADFTVLNAQATDDPDSLTAARQPYVFYSDTTGDNPAQFTDVDGGPDGSGTIYLSDAANDRIIVVRVFISRILMLRDGSVDYIYAPEYSDQVVGRGQGQSSANNPTSLVTVASGSAVTLYFAQTGGNFLVQRLKNTGASWFFDITPNAAGTPQVLELNYFTSPQCIAVGERDSRGLGLFYVADNDTSQNRVISFYPSGYRFREVAADWELVDLKGGERLADILAAQNKELNAAMNPDLVDFVAARLENIHLDSLEVLSTVLDSLGRTFDSTLNPAISDTFVAPTDTTLGLMFAADTTVKVGFPILNNPRGVATREGVVFIADSGNNRILRFHRSDAESYIPSDPNFP